MDVESYPLQTIVQASMSRLLEEEKARQACGVPLETYNKMVGTRRYAHLSFLQDSTLVCKADVLIAYRLMTQLESAVEDSVAKKQKQQ